MFRLVSFRIAVPFLVFALLVVGCSNASQPASSNNANGNSPALTEDATEDTSKETQMQEKVQLTLATAGDTNMVELQEEHIVPLFQETYPNVTVNVVGTGPGDAGSQAIYAKLKAQKDAGKEEWDTDVAVVHQAIMKDMIADDLLEPYVAHSANQSYVTSEDAVNSLGTDVKGYVIPLFHSQVALAYNPETVEKIPQNFQELEQWIKDHPDRFGYNGVKNGMSGVAFTAAYIYWKSEDYEQLTKGPYDPSIEEKWPEIIKELKALPTTITNGNNGTLEMLNRGEIDMGPVWVDMFYSWMSDGRMNPNMRLKMIDPGLPGQPMYLVIPKNAAHQEEAQAYIDLLSSPQVQADVIVGKYSWYPGIDSAVVLEEASQEAKDLLFKDISPEDLAERGLVLPLSEYLTDITAAYEEN